MNTHDASPDELLKNATKTQVVREVVRLREGRDHLLAAVKEHEGNWDESWGPHGGPPEEPLRSVWNEDQTLYKLAKELEEEGR